ncbi:hypothetical protein MAPG_05887 [Magnaporthiopsis poae ATCC 64411]|uniref:Uncharacterized protein n=1 Tax=Magnaporthiopsis poae (strain ATCC 64411 / 73-15) TaxID=644358 RepID=A0A0C4E0K8_MAGP6|nr:hypothetical protein MAPG_05887 [Magnaporthiopsis poae ATCC 64411]
MTNTDPQCQTQVGEIQSRDAVSRRRRHAQVRQLHLKQWQRDQELCKLEGIALPRSDGAPPPSQVRQQAAIRTIEEFDAVFPTS